MKKLKIIMDKITKKQKSISELNKEIEELHIQKIEIFREIFDDIIRNKKMNDYELIEYFKFLKDDNNLLLKKSDKNSHFQNILNENLDDEEKNNDFSNEITINGLENVE